MCHSLFSGDPLFSKRFPWVVSVHMMGPQGIRRCPHRSFRVLLLLWFVLVFVFSSFFSAFWWILPSLNSAAVGFPFLHISFTLLTSWQTLISLALDENCLFFLDTLLDFWLPGPLSQSSLQWGETMWLCDLWLCTNWPKATPAGSTAPCSNLPFLI